MAWMRVGTNRITAHSGTAQGEESEHTSDEEKSATSAEPERIPIKNRAALCSYFDALDNVQQRDVVCAKMS